MILMFWTEREISLAAERIGCWWYFSHQSTHLFTCKCADASKLFSNSKIILGHKKEREIKHSDLLKQLSDTVPSGFLPQSLTASFHIWRCNIKGFLKAGDAVGYWVFLYLQVASITHTQTQTHSKTSSLWHVKSTSQSSGVSKGTVLESQQERCEEKEICDLCPQRKRFIQDYKARPQGRRWAVILRHMLREKYCVINNILQFM